LYFNAVITSCRQFVIASDLPSIGCYLSVISMAMTNMPMMQQRI
jgi:hypothetical protein